MADMRWQLGTAEVSDIVAVTTVTLVPTWNCG